ncbi:MAG: thiamine phosphate synthase [Myxococcota bacterium]|nr:thiamine phosphate synthase [Myxococcota bacterium]
MLCLVAGADAPLAAITAAVAGGVDWVQLRERGLSGRQLLAWVEAAGQAARAGAQQHDEPGRLRVLVNRRIDVALAAGADGVHLGFDALDPAWARALLDAWPGNARDERRDAPHAPSRPARALVGVSAHAAAEVMAAARAGADYAHLAPIFAPLSKPAERPPLGLRALAAARRAGIPVLAQGGLDTQHAADAVRAGAAGIAVTGAVLGASDPGAAARRLRKGLDAARRGAPDHTEGSA